MIHEQFENKQTKKQEEEEKEEEEQQQQHRPQINVYFKIRNKKSGEKYVVHQIWCLQTFLYLLIAVVVVCKT
jgi:hypothetical protein